MYQTHLQHLGDAKNLPLLTRIQRGIEKEGLRVTSTATMAQTQHPQALGSALTHSSITTDYSEALLEYITPVFHRVDDSINYLADLHRFTLNHLQGEYLWPASMPCRLSGDNSIPIAQYGRSNIGKMKHVYRQGLAHRYGRTMQSIAGIHYNFSMPDDFWSYYQKLRGESGDIQQFKSQCYFDLIRNFRRHSWLLIYLFGASPVLDRSFVANNDNHNLSQVGQNTLGLPFATSLRMSDLGYQSTAQSNLAISYNDLDSYCQGLSQAITQPCPDYEKIGVKVDNHYRQLNANILQIENEYYSEIRPKRTTQSYEKPLTALKQRGVEYVEVRILDTNPLLPVGIDQQQIRFLDAFLLYCLLADSPKLTADENKAIAENQQRVILAGRNPSLLLQQQGKEVAFKQLANALLNNIMPIASLLDKAHQMGTTEPNAEQYQAYDQAVNAQHDKVDNSELTPSGLIMQMITNQGGFIESMLFQAKKHHAYFLSQQLSDEVSNQLTQAATTSWQQQQQIEVNDELCFGEFLQQYTST